MHLFAGAGGGLLADLILGHTPVVAVEWESYPCQILRERAAEGWFPNLRVWEGDVRMFDPSEYAGQVDCIHAGFPCQDISVAGKQAGVGEGTRSGLYREVLRIAGAVRPKLIFLENVAAIKSNGLEQVIKDLAIMGYDTKWLCIRASDVGAPHHRDRWFALAHTNLQHGERWPESQKSTSDCGKTWVEFVGCGSYVSDTSSERLERHRYSKIGIEKTHTSVSNSRWWEVEPTVGRMADGMAHRTHRLKSIGNGQVPLQVAVAFTILAAE